MAALVRASPRKKANQRKVGHFTCFFFARGAFEITVTVRKLTTGSFFRETTLLFSGRKKHDFVNHEKCNPLLSLHNIPPICMKHDVIVNSLELRFFP